METTGGREGRWAGCKWPFQMNVLRTLPEGKEGRNHSVDFSRAGVCFRYPRTRESYLCLWNKTCHVSCRRRVRRTASPFNSGIVWITLGLWPWLSGAVWTADNIMLVLTSLIKYVVSGAGLSSKKYCLCSHGHLTSLEWWSPSFKKGEHPNWQVNSSRTLIYVELQCHLTLDSVPLKIKGL